MALIDEIYQVLRDAGFEAVMDGDHKSCEVIVSNGNEDVIISEGLTNENACSES